MFNVSCTWNGSERVDGKQTQRKQSSGIPGIFQRVTGDTPHQLSRREALSPCKCGAHCCTLCSHGEAAVPSLTTTGRVH
jgi:hypothetical protein